MIKQRIKKSGREGGILSVPLAIFFTVGVLLLVASLTSAPKTIKEWRYSQRLLDDKEEDFKSRKDLVDRLKQEIAGDSYLHERHRRLVLIDKDDDESVIYLRGLNKNYDRDSVFDPDIEFFDLLYK